MNLLLVYCPEPDLQRRNLLRNIGGQDLRPGGLLESNVTVKASPIGSQSFNPGGQGTLVHAATAFLHIPASEGDGRVLERSIGCPLHTTLQLLSQPLQRPMQSLYRPVSVLCKRVTLFC